MNMVDRVSGDFTNFLIAIEKDQLVLYPKFGSPELKQEFQKRGFWRGMSSMTSGEFRRFISFDEIKKIVVFDKENKSSFTKKVVGGAAGSLLGPVGMVAGLLASGNNSVATVGMRFDDGKKLVVKGLVNNLKPLLEHIYALQI